MINREVTSRRSRSLQYRTLLTGFLTSCLPHRVISQGMSVNIRFTVRDTYYLRLEEDLGQRKTEAVEVRKWQCLAAGDEAVQTPDRGTQMALGVHSNGLQRGVCRIPPRIGLLLLIMEQDHSHTGRLSDGFPPLLLLPLLSSSSSSSLCFVVFLFSVPISYW